MRLQRFPLFNPSAALCQVGLWPGMDDSHLAAIALLGPQLQTLHLRLPPPSNHPPARDGAVGVTSRLNGRAHDFSPQGVLSLARLTGLRDLVCPGKQGEQGLCCTPALQCTRPSLGRYSHLCQN